MKTIAQAAIEYAKKAWGAYVDDKSKITNKTVGQISQEDFKAGAKYATTFIPVTEAVPELIEGKDHSKNVLAMVKGFVGVQVMCYMRMRNENNTWAYVWANAYGKIDGDAEFDDNYHVTDWLPIPEFKY